MMYQGKIITTSIIPSAVQYYSLPGEKSLDYKAICCFVATGFFLDDDTYYTNQKAFRPATSYYFNAQGLLEKKENHFQWKYTPREISFNQALDEFSHLFERIVKWGTKERRVILPISGGLDSRTLAAALGRKGNAFAYSYEFENGINENFYGERIAKECEYEFDCYTIPTGYLWNSIEKTAQINGCYADFINPRQIAVIDRLVDKGDLFLLGHWGDVLFDDMGVSSSIDFEDQLDVVKRKILKKGGAELAQALWQEWDLDGDFASYFNTRIRLLLEAISIDDANARIRAFKSMHWATRWTSSNLTFFNSSHSIFVPYYHDEMCKFICTLPERYLAGRKIQIEYLKQHSPSLAAIPWQKYHPCNLFTFEKYYSLQFLPDRLKHKMHREIKKIAGQKHIKSNWQLQFLGRENEAMLTYWLFKNSPLIPSGIVKTFYSKFKNDSNNYYHAISMLLVLSLFSKK